jgi:DNA polymerase III epsilon subunit-like protein
MTGPLAVLDLETTGLDVLTDRILSIDVLQVAALATE